METGSGSCLSDRNIKIVFVCALSDRYSWRSFDWNFFRICRSQNSLLYNEKKENEADYLILLYL